MKKSIYLLGIIVAMLLSSCDYSNVDMVKDYVDELNPSLSLGEVFDSYKYFTKTEWKEKESDRGEKFVEFIGHYYEKKEKKERKYLIKIQFLINKSEDGFSVGFQGVQNLSEKESKMKSYSTETWLLKEIVGSQNVNSLIELLYKNEPLYSGMLI